MEMALCHLVKWRNGCCYISVYKRKQSSPPPPLPPKRTLSTIHVFVISVDVTFGYAITGTFWNYRRKFAVQFKIHLDSPFHKTVRICIHMHQQFCRSDFLAKHLDWVCGVCDQCRNMVIGNDWNCGWREEQIMKNLAVWCRADGWVEKNETEHTHTHPESIVHSNAYDPFVRLKRTNQCLKPKAHTHTIVHNKCVVHNFY